MARVLACWEQGNGLAYIESMTATARHLKKAGHEIIFALRDLSHAERLMGGQFTFHQAPTQVLATGAALPSPMTFADVLINLGYGDAGVVCARIRAWRNLIDLVRPDVLRCTNSPGALLAARGTGIPVLAVGIGFLHPPALSPLPKVRSWYADALPERMAAREARVLACMNQALDAIDAPRVASVGALYNEIDRCDLYTYPELDDYGPRAGVNYLGCQQVAAGETPQWPAVPGKRIFAYLEPLKLIPQVLQALADTSQPVLVYMAHAPEELRTKYVHGTLAFTDRPLDIPETVAQCDIGVSHGGHNIVGSLLQAGKPQLCLPARLPERITAEKIVGLGAGLRANPEMSDAPALLTRLLTEPGFSEQARACGARLASYTLQAALEGGLKSIDTLAKRLG